MWNSYDPNVLFRSCLSIYILLYDRFIYIHEGLPSFAIPLWYYGLFFLTATKFGLGGSPQGSMGWVSLHSSPEVLQLVSCEPGHVSEMPMYIHWVRRIWIGIKCQLYGVKVSWFIMHGNIRIIGDFDCPCKGAEKNKHSLILWFPWVYMHMYIPYIYIQHI